MKKFLITLLCLIGVAHAQTPGQFSGQTTGLHPNPNASPLSADALNSAFGTKFDWLASPAEVDAREFGVTCQGGDQTAALQAAFNHSLSTGSYGGIVKTSCPVSITSVSPPGGTLWEGVGPMYYPGQSNVAAPGVPTSVWPGTVGPIVNCTSTTAGCVIVASQGVAIRDIAFGNPEPTPPSSGTYVPTIYPPIISTTPCSNWQGLSLHHLSFTSSYWPISLNGCGNYTSQFTGAQFSVDDIWFNAALKTGISFTQMDNTGTISHIHGTPSWNLGVPSMGAYQRANLVEFRFDYAAAEQFSDIECFALLACEDFTNGTVSNNFGALTFSASAILMTNVYANQSCHFATVSGGNGTIIEESVVNFHFWGDQSGFQCSKGVAFVSLPDNDVNISFSHGDINAIDTFATVGCGQACSPGGGAILRMDDFDVNTYSYYTAGQAFVNATAGSSVSFGTTNIAAIRPAPGGGPIMAPGPDGTQAYMVCHSVGGGTNALEGAALLCGGQDTTHTGFVSFYGNDNQRKGLVGYGDLTHGIELESDIDGVYLKGNYGGSNNGLFKEWASGAYTHVYVGSPPTSCGGTSSGAVAGPGEMYLSGSALVKC